MAIPPTSPTSAADSFLGECITRVKKENRLRVLGTALLFAGAAIAYREQGQPIDIKPSLLPLFLIIGGVATLVYSTWINKHE